MTHSTPVSAWTQNPHIAREDVRTFLLATDIELLLKIERETQLCGDRLIAFAKGSDDALSKYDIMLVHLLYLT